MGRYFSSRVYAAYDTNDVTGGASDTILRVTQLQQNIKIEQTRAMIAIRITFKPFLANYWKHNNREPKLCIWRALLES